MTCACMETVRERRDQKIPSSALAFGQSELYSRYFLNLGSGFVLRSPVIGKGLSVRTSSQKWPAGQAGPALLAAWGKCQHRFKTGIQPANGHNGYN